MKILIIFAHPEPASFNAALRDAATDTLKKSGHEIKVSDLYAMKFKSELSGSDFLSRKVQPEFNAFIEQLHACQTGTFTPDIMGEMEKVRWADLLIFQFPIYWTGMPAIMKGWLDRVFAAGFAFHPFTASYYEKGLLVGKKAMIVTSCGANQEMYSAGGKHGDINALLGYITHNTFEYTGMQALPTFVVFQAAGQSKEQGTHEIERFRKHLLSL